MSSHTAERPPCALPLGPGADDGCGLYSASRARAPLGPRCVAIDHPVAQNPAHVGVGDAGSHSRSGALVVAAASRPTEPAPQAWRDARTPSPAGSVSPNGELLVEVNTACPRHTEWCRDDQARGRRSYPDGIESAQTMLSSPAPGAAVESAQLLPHPLSPSLRRPSARCAAPRVAIATTPELHWIAWMSLWHRRS